MSRDENKNCGNCPYWEHTGESASGAADPDLGQCRSEPPVAAAGETNNFAVTSRTAWCRRHPNLHRKDIP